MAQQNSDRKGLREFSLTSFAVDNRTSIFLLTFMIVLFGFQAYRSMPKEQFPEASLPTVYINTPYFGNSASEIENLVTRPIEKELQSIIGIKEIKSTSVQDFSVITAEFEADLEMDEVVRKVKDAVDKARSELPTDLDEDPTVLEVNLSEIPIMTVNISGNYTMDELREYAEMLEDDIEDVSEISKVDIKGALDREMIIEVDLFKMQSLKVSFSDIENAVASENINMSGGEILTNDFRRAIRVIGQFEDADELADIIVKSENQRPIYLRDIAKVSFGYEERNSYARSDGLPVISLDVIKRKGQNLLDASDKIKVVVDEAREQYLPADLSIQLFNDQSVNTRTEVSNLENSIISGILLVILVLLFFMGLRNAMFVGLAIPISMLMGILWLHLSGTTMNMVVLFALILALGMLVDNAIVVVENIFRYMQSGSEPDDAAKYGAGEVAIPIIASTATTLAAFAPLAFWPGIMGQFMYYLPMTLILVLSSSLLVALVINPVFTSRFMKVDERADDPATRKRRKRNVLRMAILMVATGILMHLAGVQWLRNLLGITAGISLLNWYVLRPGAFYFQNKMLPKLEDVYHSFIRGSLKNRRPQYIFFGTFGLLFFAIFLLAVNTPRVIFFPSADPVYINAFVEMPMGTDIEATNRTVREVEERVNRVIEPYRQIVEAVLVQIGENTSDPNSPPEPGVTPHKARVTVTFVPSGERNGISTTAIMDEMRDALIGMPGVRIIVDKNADGPATGKPINLELKGEHIDTLAIYADKIISLFEESGIQGIEELKADVEMGKPELLVHIDREAARRYELSTATIAGAIRTAVFGKEISKYKIGEDDYPIMLRFQEPYRYNITDLLNQKITFRNPANGQIVQVPISSVASIEYSSTYSSIKRKDLERVITVYSNVLLGYNANEIVAQLKTLMAEQDLPVGVTYEFTGEQEQQAEDMGFLGMAFLVAIFAIFTILVAQFNSISAPFIIILSVLFSTIGVFLGYAIGGKDISVIFTGMGIISLAGIVVNNAIVLIDYINLLVRRKADKLGIKSTLDIPRKYVLESIILGGATRLRPVLLTAITTVLGLVPLAIGFNFNFFTLISELNPHFYLGGDNTAVWGPMAWTVIYGLVFATFLTLIVVPVMYWLTYRIKLWVYKKHD